MFSRSRLHRALWTKSTTSYLLHLSVDLVIAVVATGCILLVFTVSGWLVSILEFQPESLADRATTYEGRLVSALRNPVANLRYIYFGIIIGISAMLPTFTHMMLSIHAVLKYLLSEAGAVSKPITRPHIQLSLLSMIDVTVRRGESR